MSHPQATPAQPYQFQLPSANNDVLDAIGPVIVRYLPLLAAKAQQESSSQLYAEVIVDSVPDGVIEPILDIPTATIVDYFVLIYPPTNDERPWFVSLVDEIKLMFEEEPVPPDTGAPAEGAPSSTE